MKQPIKLIQVSLRFIAFHNWPDAPDRRDYLRSRHRHIFHVKVELQVKTDDREIEFHDLQEIVIGFWPPSPELGAASCERLAERIITGLHRLYPTRAITVEVSEDGENGAKVVYNPGR